MKLSNLIDGSGQSEFILIHDNKDAKGEALLIEFIKQNVRSGIKTDLLCVEKNSVILENLPVASNFNVSFIDNSIQWMKNYKDSADHSLRDPFKLFQEVRNLAKSNLDNLVVIDSLSLLFLLYPEKCYREIHHLLNFNKSGSAQCRIICLLHTDVIQSGEKTSLMFQRLARTNIYIETKNKQSQVTIKHRKSSGRVIEVTEQFYFDQSLNLVTLEIVKVKESHPAEDNKDWITKDVTFKLELEDEEKRARSELVLPYLKTHSTDGSGEIYYEPDATDDWDEEDPDDDLNI